MHLDKLMMICTQHYSIVQGSFIFLKIFCAPTLHPFLLTNLWESLIFLFCLHTFILSRISCNCNYTVCCLSFNYIISKSKPQSSRYLMNLFFLPFVCNLQTFWFRITWDSFVKMDTIPHIYVWLVLKKILNLHSRQIS